MIELVTTVIITASSVLLFGYWFRYTCLLILSAKTTRDFAGQVAAANQLGFLEVQTSSVRLLLTWILCATPSIATTPC